MRFYKCKIAFVSFVVILLVPMQIAREKLYYFVPEVGIFEESLGGILEPQMIRQSIVNKEGVTASLKEIVCEKGLLTGYAEIVDKTFSSANSEDVDMDEVREKYQYSMKVGNNTFSLGDERSVETRDNGIVIYKPRIKHTLLLPINPNKIEITISGFKETLAFSLEPAYGYKELSDIGSTVEKNGTSIVATATAKEPEGQVEVSHYVLPSEEVALANKLKMSFHTNILPYNYDWEGYYWLVTNKGKKLLAKKGKTEGKNKVTSIFDASADDFPATLYIAPLTGIRDEKTVSTLPIPNMNETLELNTVAEFSLGKVHFIEISRGISDSTDESVPKETLKVKTRWEANDPHRQLYFSLCNPVKEASNYQHSKTSHDYETDTIPQSVTTEYTFDSLTGDFIDFECQYPTYWIEGAYEIPLQLE